MRRLLPMIAALLVTGCVGMPPSVRPVTDFELNRYLGKWYEIARLDHPFERGLSQVTAEYALREDGSVQVTNRGFAEAKKGWQEARGKAYFVGDPSEAHLKVSFFGPFYESLAKASPRVGESTLDTWVCGGPGRRSRWHCIAGSICMQPTAGCA